MVAKVENRSFSHKSVDLGKLPPLKVLLARIRQSKSIDHALVLVLLEGCIRRLQACSTQLYMVCLSGAKSRNTAKILHMFKMINTKTARERKAILCAFPGIKRGNRILAELDADAPCASRFHHRANLAETDAIRKTAENMHVLTDFNPATRPEGKDKKPYILFPIRIDDEIRLVLKVKFVPPMGERKVRKVFSEIGSMLYLISNMVSRQKKVFNVSPEYLSLRLTEEELSTRDFVGMSILVGKTIKANLQTTQAELAMQAASLSHRIEQAQAAGVNMLHLDVMDGLFTKRQTIGPVSSNVPPQFHPLIARQFIEVIRRRTPTLPFDVHLMVQNPRVYIRELADAGVDILTLHTEKLAASNRVGKEMRSIFEEIARKGMYPGLAINPGTSIDTIYSLGYLSLVASITVMGVKPGASGQSFMGEEILTAIRQLHQLRTDNNFKYIIQADGGINEVNALIVKEAGANSIVAASALFRRKDLEAVVAALKGK